jgi:uncharacterized protein YbjT (DUF2867 family)
MNVFITGGTGYIGGRVIGALLERGHTVRALIRPGSEKRLAADARPILGNALDASTFARHIAPSETFIHLVGVAHPSPAKAEEFRTIDLVSIRESVQAVAGSSIRHFIYLSVAHPAPAMKAYVAVREEGERLLRESGIPATFVRPWYVLGPGHWWPYAILPAYWIWSAVPSQRDTARRLYPVKLAQVVRAIVDAVEHPPADVRVIEAPEMRNLREHDDDIEIVERRALSPPN